MRTIKGRAYTKLDKAKALTRLLVAWVQAPTLRLGQLIYICIGDKDLFYVEDNVLIRSIERYIRECQRRMKSN